MKKSLFIFPLLFIFFTITTYAQYYNSELESKRELYERKVASYTKMKSTGWTVAGIGGGMTILGIVLMSNGTCETTTNSNGYQTSTCDATASAGILGVVVGIPATIAGIVIGSVGSRKQKEYMGKLERLKFSYNKIDNYNLVSLSYRF